MLLNIFIVNNFIKYIDSPKTHLNIQLINKRHIQK